jgi:hypothetical protein
MKIGEFLVVEFGVTGNATYIFNAGDSKIDFSRTLMSIYSLKGNNYVGRLIHKSDWEEAFDQWLCPRLGWHPETGRQARSSMPKPPERPATPASLKPASQGELIRVFDFILRMKLRFEDNRSKGGPLWVKTDNMNLRINEELSRLGFRYKHGKGWWRE